MPSVPVELAGALRRELGIDRAIETGTYRGGGTRALAEIFPDVVTIELSEELYRDAIVTLSDLAHVELRLGDSAAVLKELATRSAPTFYWLDGHWSGGQTAGARAETPLLGELEAIADAHPDDAIVIDDARFFTASPPPPHDPTQWPTLIEVIDVLRRPDVPRHITLLYDQVIAVPERARRLVDEYAHQGVSETRARRRLLRRPR